MANSRVQQESKMQEQHYGVNTHPVMTTIEQFRYRLQSQVTLSEGKENHQKQNTNTETEYQYRKRQVPRDIANFSDLWMDIAVTAASSSSIVWLLSSLVLFDVTACLFLYWYSVSDDFLFLLTVLMNLHFPITRTTEKRPQ
jgi:hypothetical protein